MEHAPDVDAIRRFHLEHDMREAPERPGAQARQAELGGLACRAARRVPADVPVGRLERSDEAECNLNARLSKVALNGLIDIAARQLTRDDGLRGHRRRPVSRAARSRLRTLLKELASAGAPGGDAAPARSSSRRRRRS